MDDFLDLNCNHSSSVKYRNLGNVHVVLRVYDEDDAGRLVSSSAAAQYAEREYQYHKEKSEFLYLEIWEQCIYKAFLA